MREQAAHIAPFQHLTDEVDGFLCHVEDPVDLARGAASPAIKPNKDLCEDGKPNTEVPANPGP